MAIIVKKPGETATIPAGKVAVVCTIDIADIGTGTANEKMLRVLQSVLPQIHKAMQAQARTDEELDAEVAATKALRPSGGL